MVKAMVRAMVMGVVEATVKVLIIVELLMASAERNSCAFYRMVSKYRNPYKGNRIKSLSFLRIFFSPYTKAHLILLTNRKVLFERHAFCFRYTNARICST